MNTQPHLSDSLASFQPVVSVTNDVPLPQPKEAGPADAIHEEFDAYAAQYESALNEGLSVSGEGPEYFAQRRVEWVASILPTLNSGPVHSILDFGCGVGIATPLLQAAFHPNSICGFDPSSAAIDRANREFADEVAQFTCSVERIPARSFDLAYCNGVFHHIQPQDRPAALRTVYRSLKPGGWFAFWENNPWNPGTRFVMSRIPFDRDAVVISPREAKKLLMSEGFEVARFDALFLFPRFLSWLRPVELLVHRWPFGAQYLVLAQKPN